MGLTSPILLTEDRAGFVQIVAASYAALRTASFSPRFDSSKRPNNTGEINLAGLSFLIMNGNIYDEIQANNSRPFGWDVLDTLDRWGLFVLSSFDLSGYPWREK